MTLQVDIAAVRRFAAMLVERADTLHHARCRDASLIARLQLDDAGWYAIRPLEAAIDAMWAAALFTALLADSVEAGDVLDADSLIAALVDRSDGLAGRGGFLAGWRTLLGASGPRGELGQTYDAELRAPYTILGATPVDLGRDLVLRALADTADDHQLRADEFGLVQMAEDRYVVVLPGVTDLSRPDWDLDADNRSVRDLDRYAIASSRSSDVADNRYAQMVAEALDRTGVPAGARLAIVGHSFGADTALDLAADPEFRERYVLSHVVAAGYWSGPQLPDVLPGVEVLVLQNSVDAAVIVESVGHSRLAMAAEARTAAVNRLLDGDLASAWVAAGEAVGHRVSAVRDGGGFVVDHADELIELGAGVAGNRWHAAAGEALELVRLDAGVVRHGDVVVDVFDGAASGAGHHPANYADHLGTVDDPDVERFLDSLGAAGFNGWGAAVAVDVSVPGS